MTRPEPPPRQPVLEAITWIEAGDLSRIRLGRQRFVWWDRALWWRTYQAGGFDGYRTLTGRRLPCGTMETAVRCPAMRGEIRRLAAR